MPKDEFDPEDPFELSGVGILASEESANEMCDCFIEEYMRMGHDAEGILYLFKNQFFLAVNMILQNRGEPFVRTRIEEVFARWGRVATWKTISEIPKFIGSRI